MSLTTYGFTSKAYPFGNPPGGSAPSGLPTKLLAIADYHVANGERVVIKVTLGNKISGAYNWLTLLDVERDSGGVLTVHTDLLEQEVPVGPTGSNITPGAVSDWVTIIKAEIQADPVTPVPYALTEPVTLYTYRNNTVGRPVADTSLPVISPLYGAAMSDALRQYLAFQNATYTPLPGVQARFFARGTPILIATATSDVRGEVNTNLPPGSYDVYFYGAGFTQNDAWVGTGGLSVGLSDAVTRFGTSMDRVATNAEYSVIKDRMASLRWVGYLVPEDFTAGREACWNPATDTAYTGSDTRLYPTLAPIYFGRMFQGGSFIEYIAVGTDPFLLG